MACWGDRVSPCITTQKISPWMCKQQQGLPVRSSFHLTLILVMTLRVWPLTDLNRCASSAIIVSHLMPRNVELSLSTVSYDVCIPNSETASIITIHLHRVIEDTSICTSSPCPSFQLYEHRGMP